MQTRDRPNLWRSRISGAPRARSPSRASLGGLCALVLHRIRDTRLYLSAYARLRGRHGRGYIPTALSNSTASAWPSLTMRSLLNVLILNAESGGWLSGVTAT